MAMMTAMAMTMLCTVLPGVALGPIGVVHIRVIATRFFVDTGRFWRALREAERGVGARRTFSPAMT
jgi:hypothetical protein